MFFQIIIQTTYYYFQIRTMTLFTYNKLLKLFILGKIQNRCMLINISVVSTLVQYIIIYYTIIKL